MKRFAYYLCALSAGIFVINGCTEEEQPAPIQEEVPQHIINKLNDLGFDTENQAPLVFEEGYLVEGDIYLKPVDIDNMKPATGLRIATEEQYSTNNLVSVGSGRVVTIYIPQETSGGGGNGGGKGKKPGGGGGGDGFSATYVDAVDEAISRYNTQTLGLELTFQRINNSNADIVFTRLNKRDERRGVLGSAGFPTSSGDPYGQIKMSGVLESTYGLSVNGIATIIAHEMGHCIGFRHTDYFDRSISCGGGTSNEGDGGVGANHIPGTPTGATSNAQSWMLACTDGSDRPFNNDDKTALTTLYDLL